MRLIYLMHLWRSRLSDVGEENVGLSEVAILSLDDPDVGDDVLFRCHWSQQIKLTESWMMECLKVG